MKQLMTLALGTALLAAACREVVDLTPTDADGVDASIPPDALSEDGSSDAGPSPIDAFPGGDIDAPAEPLPDAAFDPAPDAR
jgi:hypothetical protein